MQVNLTEIVFSRLTKQERKTRDKLLDKLAD